MKTAKFTIALASLVGAAFPAFATPLSLTAFGHTVEIVRQGDFGEQLLIDGEMVHEDGYIALDQIGYVGTTDVIVGTTASGGNLCAESRFIISFPDDKGGPVFDGPMDTCELLDVTIEANDILFQGQPSPARPGEQWSWHPDGLGFIMEAPIPFVANTASVWEALANEDINHPAFMFYYEEALAVTGDVFPADVREELMVALTGPASWEYRNGLYVGDSCFPYNCPYLNVLVVADIERRQLLLAWRVEDEDDTIAPDVSEWPEAALAELERWRSGAPL